MSRFLPVNKFVVAVLAATAGVLGAGNAQASNVRIVVTETGQSQISEIVAAWTQDQNPVPINFVKDYYTTVPVFDATGLGGDKAVTWYSDIDGHFGGFSNYSEQFNVLAPLSYAFSEKSPTFVPGDYHGVDIKPDFTYLLADYTITVLPDAALKPVSARFTPLMAFAPRSVSVPEPESWAMMLVGLGLIGFAARRGRVSRVSYTG